MEFYKNNTANIEIRTLRDEIAIAAMQGIMSIDSNFNDLNKIALISYKMADIMLEARKEKP